MTELNSGSPQNQSENPRTNIWLLVVLVAVGIAAVTACVLIHGAAPWVRLVMEIFFIVLEIVRQWRGRRR